MRVTPYIKHTLIITMPTIPNSTATTTGVTLHSISPPAPNSNITAVNTVTPSQAVTTLSPIARSCPMRTSTLEKAKPKPDEIANQSA